MSKDDRRLNDSFLKARAGVVDVLRAWASDLSDDQLEWIEAARAEGVTLSAIVQDSRLVVVVIDPDGRWQRLGHIDFETAEPKKSPITRH